MITRLDPDPAKVGMALGYVMVFIGIAVIGNIWLAMLIMGALLLCCAFATWVNS